MNNIIIFFIKWFMPIGFIKFLPIKDRIFSKDVIGNSTYWRICNDEKYEGAGALIRRSGIKREQ